MAICRCRSLRVSAVSRLLILAAVVFAPPGITAAQHSSAAARVDAAASVASSSAVSTATAAAASGASGMMLEEDIAVMMMLEADIAELRAASELVARGPSPDGPDIGARVAAAALARRIATLEVGRHPISPAIDHALVAHRDRTHHNPLPSCGNNGSASATKRTSQQLRRCDVGSAPPPALL